MLQEEDEEEEEETLAHNRLFLNGSGDFESSRGSSNLSIRTQIPAHNHEESNDDKKLFSSARKVASDNSLKASFRSLSGTIFKSFSSQSQLGFLGVKKQATRDLKESRHRHSTGDMSFYAREEAPLVDQPEITDEAKTKTNV